MRHDCPWQACIDCGRVAEGGLTIPLIAAARPAHQLVFLAAMIPRPGKAHDEVLGAEPDIVTGWLLLEFSLD